MWLSRRLLGARQGTVQALPVRPARVDTAPGAFCFAPSVPSFVSTACEGGCHRIGADQAPGLRGSHLELQVDGDVERAPD